VSGADIVRAQIAIALGDSYAIDVPDADMDRWETVGDVVRSVVGHTERHLWEPPLTEAEALAAVRQLLPDEWQIPPEQVTAEAPLFGDPLRLASPGRFHW
jgi:hypothetical protein